MKAVVYLLVLVCSSSLCNAQLVISQYVETNSGSSPKGIEVWNVSSATIFFSSQNLEVRKGINGATPNTDFSLSSDSLPSGAVMVIGSSDLQSTTELNGASFHLKPFTFNGDDALTLFLNGVKVDAFGMPGQDPGTHWEGNNVETRNSNIELKTGIFTTDTSGFTDPSAKFRTNPSSLFDGFGIPPQLVFSGTWAFGEAPNLSTEKNNCVVSSGTVNLTVSALINKLSISPGASLSIDSAISLNLGSDLTNNGACTIQPGGNLFLNEQASSDSITLILSGFTGSNQEYNFLSSPVASLNLTSVFAGSNINDFYTFNPSLITDVNFASAGWTSISTASPGLGFAATPNVQNPAAAVNIIGQANKGDISVTLQQNGVPAEGMTENFNLVGNPYPCGISAASFLSANSNIVQAIYLWDADRNGGQYITVDGSPDMNINMGQGFFVDWLDNSGNNHLLFNHSMRIGSQDGLVKKAAIPTLILSLSTENGDADHCTIKFHEDYSNGFDRKFDAIKFQAAERLSLYSFEPSKKWPLSIQALASLEDSQSIALGFESSSKGVHGIKLDTAIAWFELQAVYLNDKSKAYMHNLVSDGTYWFTPDEYSSSERFELVWAPNHLSSYSNTPSATEFYCYQAGSEVVVESNDAVLNVALFSLSGAQLAEESTNKLETSRLRSGLYLIKVQTSHSVGSQLLFIQN